MVRLFAKTLKFERAADGSAGYVLVTPYERHVVLVEDAPFVAVALQIAGVGQNRRLTFVTNVDGEVTADGDHPISVRTGAAGDPRPYLALDGGMEALIARPVYYELAALAEPDAEGRLGVWSGGMFFPLDPTEWRR